jgi:ABC-type sulfate transport system permease component
VKKYIAATVLIIVFLAVFIPLASSNPDALEKVAQTFGGNEQKTFWEGFMTNYSISFIGNSYISTLLAGVFGTIMVLIFALLLGKVIVHEQDKV